METNTMDEDFTDSHAGETPPRSGRKINIVLPPEDDLPSTSRLRNNQDQEQRRMSDALSVSSYVIQHSRRFGGGEITPQFWNDLAPYLSPRSSLNPRTTSNGWSIGGTTRTLSQRLMQAWQGALPDVEEGRLPKLDASEYESEMRTHSRLRSHANTPTISSRSYRSSRMGSTVLTPIPIVKFQKPQVAVKKGVINYSDVPLLRRQLSQAQAKRKSQKFRQDYARTTNDIYRMRLNDTDNLEWERQNHFRKTCATYLGTSPGASRALAGQLPCVDSMFV